MLPGLSDDGTNFADSRGLPRRPTSPLYSAHYSLLPTMVASLHLRLIFPAQAFSFNGYVASAMSFRARWVDCLKWE
jgi:hypothetical protein